MSKRLSESEIHAVMKEQARKKQEDQRKFLEYRSTTQGDRYGRAFPLLITPFLCSHSQQQQPCRGRCAIEPDGSATRPFPPHQVSTGSGWTSLTVPALPSCTGVPFKHAQGLHSSSGDDNEPLQPESGGFEGGDTKAAMSVSLGLVLFLTGILE